MAKILSMKDRIKLTIGEIVFTIAPLSYGNKQELLSCTKVVNGEDHYDLLKAQALYIKYAVKGVEGIKKHSGEAYGLEFEGGFLTDDCVSELLSIECREELMVAAWQQLNGAQSVVNPVTFEKMEGIKVEVETEGKLYALEDVQTL